MTRALLAPGGVLALPGLILVLRRGGRLEQPHQIGEVLRSWYGWLVEAERCLRTWSVGDEPILLLGETGTGKLELARRVHHHRERQRGPAPLVRVNLRSWSDSTWTSELFGHERGAFTGAVDRHPGALGEVGAGVLFLDELGRMPRAAQHGLLTLLDGDRSWRSVGGRQTRTLDAVVVAASDKPLDAEGGFEQALYWRLAQRVLRVPPLRERPADVLLLASILGLRAERLRQDQVERLLRAEWPGNVRELASTVLALEREPVDEVLERLTVEDESLAWRARRPDPETLERLIAEHGSMAAVARHLGVDRSTVGRWRSG